MARVKPKRRGPSMDLTAMSDMAWLLLTFFILTSNFREPEVVPVVTPTSVSNQKMAAENMMIIKIDGEGKFLFGLEEKDRIATLEKMGDKYGVKFTDAEKNAFKSIVEFGVPMKEMRNYLNQPADKQQSYHPGIPLDTIPEKNQELIDWVFEAKEVNPDVFLAIKGDQKSEYKQFKNLIQQLQMKNMNKFQLITSQE
ncbi:biopolymer transporter ExbD [Empedobacter falsenii]|uniref:Biopolymer transporter ExbD n=1 Tax=Empedobacter falsenii TaxID=343874 RepID=A0A7H9DPW8_9FLAO|nr:MULTISPECIES: biopolymer transporter ExbD [Empedobacter]MDH2208204.1 biopolymer transporter ExbD [Empedobacter sp. GD03644]MDM1063655.1 biopolymer transporter ExbD [Empedobacter falsenii]MDM1552813.1 biopolymer transporter ExbD [Empedobacter falsenii]QLL57045.1 biopolymer transporter ExbD [Empedobacter falsenii]